MAQRKGGSQAGCFFRFYYTTGLDTTEKQVPGPRAHKHERPLAQPLPAPDSPLRGGRTVPFPSSSGPEGPRCPCWISACLPPGQVTLRPAVQMAGMGWAWAWGAAKLKAKSPIPSFRRGRPPDLSPPPIPAPLCRASLRFTPSPRAFRALAPLVTSQQPCEVGRAGRDPGDTQGD